MAKYIKTHSNYVKQTLHQDVNDGKILDRDWTTIGGVDCYTSNQKTAYQSGNFIITTNDEVSVTKDFQKTEFEKINDSEEWTLSEIEKAEENDIKSEEDNLNNIVIKNNTHDLREFAYFGSCRELIRSSITDILARFPGELYCSDKLYFLNIKNELVQLRPIGYETYQYVVSNPFKVNIDLDTYNLKAEDNPLKFFSNEGYKNYTFNGNEITSYSVQEIKKNCYNVGEVMKVITINGTNIVMVKGDFGVLYMHNSIGTNIRPKKKFLTEFYNSLNRFEKVILNPHSKPKYTAKFNLLEYTDFGLKTYIDTYTFPCDEGGYNVGGDESLFQMYLNKLYKLSENYDEYFTDNIWRMMTHEGIKNFDWSYKRNFDVKATEEHIEGGEKISKILRIYGREFDEIKAYIDNIKFNNVVTYNDNTNGTADYFLSDLLENDGWDYKNVLPYKSYGNGNCFKFSQIQDVKVSPYDNCNAYYIDCNGSKTSITDYSKDQVHVDNKFFNVFKDYCSNDEVSYLKVNTEFTKRLKINSRHILRHKGTIEGIEMLLSLFGFRSDRWVNRMNNTNLNSQVSQNFTSDYSITEHYIKGIQPIAADKIKKYNSYKTLYYKNQEQDPYSGLPCKEINGVLYPFYNSSKIYDGNMYYQMNGGWIKYYFDIFNDKGCLIAQDWLETLRGIRYTNSVKELLKSPYYNFYWGVIYKIPKVGGNFVMIDDVMYDITFEPNGNKYISLFVNGGSVRIGNSILYDSLVVGDGAYYSLYDKYDGYEIKVYLNGNTLPPIGDGRTITKNDTQVVLEKEFVSGYYKLVDVENADKFRSWTLLSEAENEKINAIEDYFEGNNPHSGNLSYDNGTEYLRRYASLFKYALDTNSFDKRCFLNGYETSIDEIRSLGFKIGGLDMNDPCSEDYTTTEADKDDGKIFFVDKDEITHGNMNVKLVTLDFSNLFSKMKGDTNGFKKYFLSTIMSYVQQMLPLTAICHVKN